MIFDDFDPKDNTIFRLIDNEGNVLNAPLMPDIDDATVVQAYKAMLFARVADEMAVSFQRQGRMYTYPPNKGQEAIAIAAGMIMRTDDWLVPVFRELGTWLAKGISMKEIFLYYAMKIKYPNYELIAREWNGSGRSTLDYWKKVKINM